MELDGKLYPVPIRREERRDVADIHGERQLQAGFVAEIPAELRELISDARIPRLLHQGDPLPIASDAVKLARVQGNIDRVEMFQIEGWAVCRGRRPRTLELVCAGQKHPLKPFWLRREDAAEATAAEELEIGFRAELPAYLWAEQGEASRECVVLKLAVENEEVDTSITISRQAVLDWIEAACRAEPENSYWLFCAIEHAHYAKIHEVLSQPGRKKLADFAGRYKLDAYLPKAVRLFEAGATPRLTRILWAALRSLNAALPDDYDLETFWERSATTAENLPRQVRGMFYDAITPTLCRLDGYDRLLASEDYDIDHRLAWQAADDVWALSIALAAFAARRRLDKCAEILWRLAQNPNKGWLNTECLEDAARRAVRGFLAGRVTIAELDKFIYGYLAVLDGFRSDYWHSRLYDACLINGSVHFLDGFDRYPDYLRRDLMLGLLKHYALVPKFWRDVAHHAPLLAGEPLWRQASQDAGRILNELSQPTCPGDMSACVAVLRRLDRLGNADARRWAREWLGPQMEAVNADLNHPGHQVLEFLLEEREEGVRYSAFPLVNECTLAKRYASCGPFLFDTLRHLSGRPEDFAFSRHRQWGQHANALAVCLNETPPRRGEVRKLWSTWLVEARQGDALALDLAAWLAAHPHSGLNPDSLAGALTEQLAAQPAGARPPAPLAAALARLRPRLSAAFAEGVAELLSEKYPACPAIGSVSPALSASAITWPGDTLVVIYSCRKYLDSRIPAIRTTWGAELAARGIPYVILVGDGQDVLEGDVLALDVSDHYEDLPQKTLKLIEWVYTRTDFQYLYKIDDDCYLDVARFFENLSYRRHHYYGRVIRRGEGSMDRLWHQSKSHTRIAQSTLDKSPEPSTYADGGGGWALSRWAMHVVREVLRTESGQNLLAVSYMEDKLLGDLLALQGIAPSEEEYQSYQRRRTFGAAVPVGMVENIFYPNRYTPTVMCHLDAAADQATAHALRQTSALWPKKVWPTYSPPQIAWNNKQGNQLELLSPPSSLAALLATPKPLVVAVVRNESILLPHFLEHYRRLGAGGFLIADNCSDDGTREYLLGQPDVALFSVDTEYRHSHYGVAWQQALLGNFCLGRWVVLADADELLVYRDYVQRPLDDFLAAIEAAGADALKVGMIDMYPYGDLDEADFTRLDPFAAAPWFDARPLAPWRLGSGHYSNERLTFISALRHRLDGDAEPNAFVAMKTALLRYGPSMYLARGLHYAAGVNVAKEWAWFAHFKYHTGFKAKVEAEIARGQHFDNAKEYRRYQAMLAEGRGRFGAEGVSRRYTSSRDFDQILEATENE